MFNLKFFIVFNVRFLCVFKPSIWKKYLTFFYLFFQVFFVIHLHSGPMVNSLLPIIDSDPLLNCDLMDGRDAFLTLARDKHWEFSSLRRCKWSTMCMLVELHNQGQDRFVYTCNECKHHVETRWHCTVCEVRSTSSCNMLQLSFMIVDECATQFCTKTTPLGSNWESLFIASSVNMTLHFKQTCLIILVIMVS